MLKMAICDDDVGELTSVIELLNQYRVQKNQNITFDAYQSPLELVSAIQKGQRYNIILMDIIMPGENGIEAAREIRDTDKYVKIIFLTSSSEFALQSYTVGAYYYQLKPIWKEEFFRLMTAVSTEIDNQQDNSLILKCKTGISRIPLDQLEYCEVIGKTLCFHLNSGKVLESIGNMEKTCESLAPYPNFFRPHRSYIINFNYVSNISHCAITMDCRAEIPIPHGKYTVIKDTFLAQAFGKG
jgi:DNA-binding LytR/AlgR family response regulator